MHEGMISDGEVAFGYIRGILWPRGYVYNQNPATIAFKSEQERSVLGGREKNLEIKGWEAILS